MLSQKMLDFIPLVRILLSHAIPHTYIQNKISLQQGLARGRVKKHIHKWRNKLAENFDILVYYFFFSRMADAESTLDLVRKMFKIFDVD